MGKIYKNKYAGLLFFLGIIVMIILSIVGEFKMMIIMLSKNIISSRDEVINNDKNMYNFIFMSIVLNLMFIIISIIMNLILIKSKSIYYIFPLFISIIYLVGLIFIFEFFINKKNDIVNDNVKLGFMAITAGFMIIKFFIILSLIIYAIYKINNIRNQLKDVNNINDIRTKLKEVHANLPNFKF
jgi:hypothetical protein